MAMAGTADWDRAEFAAEAVVSHASFDDSHLPQCSIKVSALLDLRRGILLGRHGAKLGVLYGGRVFDPDDELRFEVLATPEDPPPGSLAVVLPIGLATANRRPWRARHSHGDGSIFEMFGAVVSPVLLQGGLAIRARVRLEVPRFLMSYWAPVSGAAAPIMAEVSHAIVLSGGESPRDGEKIGFVVERGGRPDLLEPILMHERRGEHTIAGMWTLHDRDLWTAASVLAAEAMVRRNTKVQANSESHAKRNIRFVVAQYRARVGGDPVFLPCQLVLPPSGAPQTCAYSASITHEVENKSCARGDYLTARFSIESGSPQPLRPAEAEVDTEATRRGNFGRRHTDDGAFTSRRSALHGVRASLRDGPPMTAPEGSDAGRGLSPRYTFRESEVQNEREAAGDDILASASLARERLQEMSMRMDAIRRELQSVSQSAAVPPSELRTDGTAHLVPQHGSVGSTYRRGAVLPPEADGSSDAESMLSSRTGGDFGRAPLRAPELPQVRPAVSFSSEHDRAHDREREAPGPSTYVSDGRIIPASGLRKNASRPTTVLAGLPTIQDPGTDSDAEEEGLIDRLARKYLGPNYFSME